MKITALSFLVYFLLVVSTHGAKVKCRRGCKCERNSGWYIVNCTNFNLKRLPRNLPPKTTHLNLDGNQLTKLEADSFATLPDLRYLSVRRNAITDVDKNAFNGVPKLEVIDLGGNALTFLASDTFKYLRRLKELHLSNNRIRTIAAVSGSFEHLDILDTLSLSGNLLQNLPDNSFSEISSLRNLDLSHCPLKTLSEKAFSGLRSFDKLTLSHTKLTEFPTTAAYQLRPRELDISHNQIYHINQEALNTVQRMDKSVLKWEGNPLICDCNSKALWHFLTETGDNRSPITCATPHHLAGMDLYFVQKSHLVCGMTVNEMPRFVRYPTNTSAHIGGAVVLVCQANGNPDPGVRWLKNGAPLDTDHCGMKYYQTCTGSLVVHDVDFNDVAEYTCVIESGREERLERVRRVMSKPAILSIVELCHKPSNSSKPLHDDDGTFVDSDDYGDESGSGDLDAHDHNDDESPPPDGDAAGRLFVGTSCPDPGIPENGKRFIHGQEWKAPLPFKVKVTIKYSCRRYFELEGENSLVCQSNGTWSAPLPKCIPACGEKDITSMDHQRHRRSTVIPNTTVETGPRIINGRPSLRGEWPWLGFFAIGYHSCGVSLISQTWAISAAHCVAGYRDKDTSDMHIYFGRYSSTQHELGQQGRSIRRIITHPNYSRDDSYDYDIALIELEAPVELDSNTRPVCLPPLSATPNGSYDQAYSEATVMGWGRTSNDKGAGVAREQHTGVVKIADQVDCVKTMKTVTDRMLCAGEYADTCAGDSGGPLVTLYDKRYYLAGITSWGPTQCGTYYGVYTRVTNQGILTWIYRIIGDSTSS